MNQQLLGKLAVLSALGRGLPSLPRHRPTGEDVRECLADDPAMRFRRTIWPKGRYVTGSPAMRENGTRFAWFNEDVKATDWRVA